MRNCQNKREKSPNTRFNADICFVTKVAQAVAADAAPFYATFAPTLPSLCATAKAQMQVKRMLNGRCASVQRAAESPPVVRRVAPSNMRIKLTAKLKSLSAFSLLAAYPPPVRLTCLKAGGYGTNRNRLSTRK